MEKKQKQNWKAMIHLCTLIIILGVVGVTVIYLSSDFPETVSLKYSDPYNWYALGEKPEAEADVFYLYGDIDVSDLNSLATNVDVSNFEVRKLVHDIILLDERKFPDELNTYIPYYRQTTYVGTTTTAVLTADAIAYSDAKAAFHQYITVWNKNRPYIIAGSGQGAVYAERLITDWISVRPEYLKNLQGVYLDGVYQDDESPK